LLNDNALIVAGLTLTANQSGATYQWLDCNNNNAALTGNSTDIIFTTNGNYIC